MRVPVTVLILTLALPPGSVAAQGDPYVGTFSNGVLVLQLQATQGGYTGVAVVQGQQFPVTARQTTNGLEGSYSAQGTTYPWTAALQGDLLVMYVDAQTLQLQRQAVGTQPTPATQPPGTGTGGQPQLSRMGQEWLAYLAGKRVTRIESYSSYDGTGGGGGYSAREEFDLCSDGRFFYSGSSSVSVDVGGTGGYSGGADGGAGSWRIVEQGNVVGIELRWNNGNVGQALLEYRDGGTYVDGQRMYVTNDNTSCR